jgi:hypothetical protein
MPGANRGFQANLDRLNLGIGDEISRALDQQQSCKADTSPMDATFDGAYRTTADPSRFGIGDAMHADPDEVVRLAIASISSRCSTNPIWCGLGHHDPDVRSIRVLDISTSLAVLGIEMIAKGGAELRPHV